MHFRGLIVLSACVFLLACGGSTKHKNPTDAGMGDAQIAVEEPDANTPDAMAPDAMPMQTADAGLTLSVPDATYLDMLTSEQANALCTWMVDIQGGPHAIQCDGGTSLTIDPVADCLQNPWPHCQVGLLRPCIEAQAKDECAGAPAACTTFYQCAGGV